MYKIKKYTSSIFHFEFVRKCDLFLSMMRLQEWYECKHKNIKGKKFTLEDLIEAYCELDKDGEFNYFSDWAAFNFPDTAVRGFLKLMGDNLNEWEKKIIKDIKKTLDEADDKPIAKTYYIATYTKNNSDSERDLKHELAHGLFYSQSMYNKVMVTLLDNLKQNKAVYKRLKEMGYCDDVLIDEAQAYLCTGSLSELKAFEFPILTEKDVKPFRETFKQFTNSIKQKQKKEKGLFM